MYEDLSRCHLPISYQMQREVNNTIQTKKQENEETRRHTERYIGKPMQDLEMSQNRQDETRRRQKYSQRQREDFLASLTYQEINLWMKEVSLSHPGSFGWMFADDIKCP